jgi:trk system potassium uptake protein TrkA
MNVLLAGGGKVGRQLAILLKEKGHHATVIEIKPEHVNIASRVGPEVTVLGGDATDPGMLAQAGARDAQVFIAATGSDEVNMLSCYLARTHFGIPKTVARVNDPRNEHMFTPEYGCDTAISYSDIIARIVIEETSFSDVVTLLRLRRGELALVEGEVHEGSLLAGKTLSDAGLPPGIVVVAVLRGDKVLIARGLTRIVAGDRLVALYSGDSEDLFRDLLR